MEPDVEGSALAVVVEEMGGGGGAELVSSLAVLLLEVGAAVGEDVVSEGSARFLGSAGGLSLLISALEKKVSWAVVFSSEAAPVGPMKFC